MILTENKSEYPYILSLMVFCGMRDDLMLVSWWCQIYSRHKTNPFFSIIGTFRKVTGGLQLTIVPRCAVRKKDVYTYE